MRNCIVVTHKQDKETLSQRKRIYSVATKRKAVMLANRLKGMPTGFVYHNRPVKSRMDIVRLFDIKSPSTLDSWEQVDLSDVAINERCVF